MNEPYTKLFKRIVDWEYFGDAHVLQLFIYLISTANFKAEKWRGMVIMAGQKVTSIDKLANACECSKNTIQRCLKVLVESGTIELQNDNKKTIVTICNYPKYQQNKEFSVSKTDTQVDTQPNTLTDMQVDTQPDINIRNKEYKNEKKDSNIFSPENENSAADESAINKPQPKSIEERKKYFMQNVADSGLEKYGQEMCREFFEYWTEKNPNGKKMRFEMEKVFDINRRLSTWNKNNFKTNSNGNKRDIGNVSTERIIAAGRAMANAGI